MSEEKEVEVIVRNSESRVLERKFIRVDVDEVLVGKWVTIDLKDLPPLGCGDTLEIWTGTICD